jgi:SAM-dependent methyltransferase
MGERVSQPVVGDAVGQVLLDGIRDGRAPAFVVERPDGFVAVDDRDYLGGLSGREEWAVSRAAGRVLDVGAGAGRGALALQERGQDVTALDTSPGAVEACRRRGVKTTFLGTVAQAAGAGMAGGFDSALLLGNNLGLLGSSQAAPGFISDLAALLRPGGVIVGTGADGGHDDVWGGTPGHVTMRIRYQRLATDWFDWCVMSPVRLAEVAGAVGWGITDLCPGQEYAVVLARQPPSPAAQSAR